MKADKKLSIKVKSKTEHRIMDGPELEMISVWNIKKIIYALIVLIVIIVVPAYYFSSQDNDVANKENNSPILSESILNKSGSIQEDVLMKLPAETSINKTTSEQSKVSQQDIQDIASTPAKEITPEKPIAQMPVAKPVQNPDAANTKEVVVTKNTKKTTPATNTELLNSHITRARLAQGVTKLEPYGKVKLPILVDSSKAQGITYFTEVNNMKGSTVNHEWLKEGKSIYKRKIIIRGDRWRMFTSKLFTITSAGQWQVRLITQQGDILHKTDFLVKKR